MMADTKLDGLQGAVMQIQTAYSRSDEIHEAVLEIKTQFGDLEPKVVLFFASSKYAPETTAATFKEIFPKALTFGCSTAGEIVSRKMLKNAVVAMALSDKVIGDVCIQIVERIGSEDNTGLAFQAFEKHFGVSAFEMDFEKFVGLVLTDGLSGAEERLMDQIGDLTDVLFVGASAGDDLKFSKTWVYADGSAYTDASLLVLLKPLVPFGFIKTQSFVTRPGLLVPTKVNESTREVLEFNGMPAATAYAQTIGIPKEDLESRFMLNPVGLMINDEPYVRSPQRLKGDTMVFYCKVSEGMALSLLEAIDIINDTRLAVEKKSAEMAGISGIINFHCILRTLELERKNSTEKYAEIFADIPTVGFSTYGEAFLGHLNQTSTMLVFK
jgi:hypothetical protein